MTPRTHIFAVAVENYQDRSIPSVDYAENDAQKFVEAWEALGVDPADCVILLSSQATLAAVRSRLNRFLTRVQTGDRFILFYAGHGAAFSDVSHITVHDTQRGDIQNTSIPLSEVLSAVRSSRSTQVLLFFDSCHSGLPVNSGMRSIYSAFTGDELVAFCSDAEYHFAFSSCKVNEFSFPSRAHQHGIWSFCVIQALKGLARDALEQGRLITATSLQGYLSEEVPRILRVTITGTETQTPCIWGNATKELIVADLEELLAQRQLLSGGPVSIIKDSSLLGESFGQVRHLSGYKKPIYPLSKHSSWEERFIENAGEGEVKDLAEEIHSSVKAAFSYKRKDISYSNDGATASIKTPDFDVDIGLFQNPEAADRYVLRIQVSSFRRPEIINDPDFIKIFSEHCDSIVIELDPPLDIEAKIDEIEEIAELAAGLEYEAECTSFRLELPQAGVLLHVSSEKIIATLIGNGDLQLLIGNTAKGFAQLAGSSVTLSLPGSTP
jgi:hypothetical protein